MPKHIKLSTIKNLKITVEGKSVIVKDREEIRQILQGNPSIRKEIEVEIDDLKKHDTRNF